MKNGSMKNTTLLFASLAVAVLLLGASSFTITTKARAQASSPSQTQTASGDIKSKAKDTENTVISSLKAYADAIDAKFIESDLFNKTTLASSNITGGIPTVVNQTAYKDAKDMITKAHSQLQSMLQIAKLDQAIQIAKVQGGLEALKNIVERKAPFNLAEDIVQSPIVNNLRQLSSS
jgi:hypothetical protein